MVPRQFIGKSQHWGWAALPALSLAVAQRMCTAGRCWACVLEYCVMMISNIGTNKPGKSPFSLGSVSVHRPRPHCSALVVASLEQGRRPRHCSWLHMCSSIIRAATHRPRTRGGRDAGAGAAVTVPLCRGTPMHVHVRSLVWRAARVLQGQSRTGRYHRSYPSALEISQPFNTR